MGSPTAPTPLVVWRSTTEDHGRACAVTRGVQQTLMWLVINLGFLLPIPAGPPVVFEGEVFVYRIVLTR